MKTKTLNITATIVVPTILLCLAGCKSAPVNPLATQTSPTLAGGMPVIQTFKEKVVITSMVASERRLALRTGKGDTITCKAAPQVSNFNQLQVGETVKATITDAVVLFPAKSTELPSAGPGVEISGSAEGAAPSTVVLQTTDSRARAINVDPSYRLLKVEYANGSKKEFKVPLPYTLENVHKGDEVVVRATEPLAIWVQPR